MAAPAGNKNAARAAQYRHALELELSNYVAEGVSKGMALRKVARSQIEKAIAGDTMAARDIADRLDGKAAQQVTVGGDKDNPVVLNVFYND